MTTVFETPRFRVQITGKSAWLEVKEAGAWVLRNQHTLPVSADAMVEGDEFSALRAAVEDFGQTPGRQQSLREALTGVRTAAKAEIPKAAVAAHKAPPLKPAGKRVVPPRASSARQGFRLPLRPPLAAPLGAK